MGYRRRRSLGEWRDLLEEYEPGSEDLSSFCCRHDVPMSTFLSKRRALKRSENVLVAFCVEVVPIFFCSVLEEKFFPASRSEL